VENARAEIHYQSNNIIYVGDNQTSIPKFWWIDEMFLSALKTDDRVQVRRWAVSVFLFLNLFSPEN
jgi:hypothetical protein